MALKTRKYLSMVLFGLTICLAFAKLAAMTNYQTTINANKFHVGFLDFSRPDASASTVMGAHFEVAAVEDTRMPDATWDLSAEPQPTFYSNGTQWFNIRCCPISCSALHGKATIL